MSHAVRSEPANNDFAPKQAAVNAGQQLSIALALIGNPKVAVLDEMTTGLDPQARRDTWQLIEQVRDRDVTIILVTHYMDEAERLCDRSFVRPLPLPGEAAQVGCAVTGRRLRRRRRRFRSHVLPCGTVCHISSSGRGCPGKAVWEVRGPVRDSAGFRSPRIHAAQCHRRA